MSDRPPVRVYFLGSGKLAIPVCAALSADARVHLLGVGTQPDRAAGRRRRPRPTPLGAWADERQLEPERIPSVNTEAFLDRLRALDPEVLLVASFGQILKPDLLALPACGCLNVHASLLPRHRGASPVNAAILAGDESTGVSFMRMDAGLDTGPVYARRELPIDARETAEALEGRLGDLAAAHLGEVLWAVAREGLRAEPQDETCATYAGKLRKSQGAVDWERPATAIDRQIRGLIPWPKAHTFVATERGRVRIQITEAIPAAGGDWEGAPGETLVADKEQWIVACGSGALRLLRLVPEGRREMSAGSFLRGHPLQPETPLGPDGQS